MARKHSNLIFNVVDKFEYHGKRLSGAVVDFFLFGFVFFFFLYLRSLYANSPEYEIMKLNKGYLLVRS